MIHGHLISAGTMEVDGETLTGCFVECTVEELRANKPDIYKDVIITLDEDKKT